VRFIYLLAMIAVLSSCTLPESRVSVGDERPGIAIAGAADGQILYVDGLRMGQAKTYDGKPGILSLEKGRHKIEIRNAADEIVFTREVFLGPGETLTVTLGYNE